jgi:O-succinylhomoserine sulfhydrylase
MNVNGFNIQLNYFFTKHSFLKSYPQYDIAIKQMKAGGNVIAFEVKGGIETGRDFLNALQICSLTANLGDTRTIATHPASTTHSKLSLDDRLEVGITDGLVRLSIGLENVDDIIEDVRLALG